MPLRPPSRTKLNIYIHLVFRWHFQHRGSFDSRVLLFLIMCENMYYNLKFTALHQYWNIIVIMYLGQYFWWWLDDILIYWGHFWKSHWFCFWSRKKRSTSSGADYFHFYPSLTVASLINHFHHSRGVSCLGLEGSLFPHTIPNSSIFPRLAFC